MFKYIFPFEIVPAGSRVIIYGAGAVGRQYAAQLMQSDYYELICAVDKNANKYISEQIVLECPEGIGKHEFDYLVIAVKEEGIADEIKRDLQELYWVKGDKIVWLKPDRFVDCRSLPIQDRLTDIFTISRTEVTIGIFLGASGFGDEIISKKLVMEIAEATDFKCWIDIYVEDLTYDFVCVLFSDMQCVKNVYRAALHDYSRYRLSYDLAFSPFYIFAFDHRNDKTLQEKNPSFAALVQKMDDQLRHMGLFAGHPVEYSILFSIAEKQGKNAYTMQSFDGLLHIEDTVVHVPLLDGYEEAAEALLRGKRPFVTVNYGWGMNAHGGEVVPAKIWPLGYYERLVVMIKDKYPELHIVQIGRKNSPRIPKVDVFLQDEHIESVKYILRDSLLHIDSEGGMVHLATQLGTKCLVAFGPTPVHFFGYESNINVRAGSCFNCCYLNEDFTKCIRNLEEPECMYSITPEMMFQKFEEYMKECELENSAI